MIGNLKQNITKNIINIPGWRTSKKIVVIESDDWGTLRMGSSDTYKTLLKAGVPVDKDPYSRYDSLETKRDLEELFDVLQKQKDKNGNFPVLTANTIVGNPDFEKIRESAFKHYYFESFEETQKRQNGLETLALWKEGIKNKFLMPQFHGREHLNVALWMEALLKGSEDYLKAFDYDVFGINGRSVHGKRANYMAALDWNNEKEKNEVIEITREGLQLFEKVFGFSSRTMIAPCYIWSNEIEEAANSLNVEGFQGISYQYIPNLHHSYAKKFHYTGQKNKLGQYYMVRNAFFEPTLEPKTDNVNECLKRIEIAFRWGKPAIIGSHRINFMGALVQSNRDNNLKLLNTLLSSICKTWPNVEFMSSDALTALMKTG